MLCKQIVCPPFQFDSGCFCFCICKCYIGLISNFFTILVQSKLIPISDIGEVRPSNWYTELVKSSNPTSIIVSQIIHITLLIKHLTIYKWKVCRFFSFKTYGHLKNQMTLNYENIAHWVFFSLFVCLFLLSFCNHTHSSPPWLFLFFNLLNKFI